MYVYVTLNIFESLLNNIVLNNIALYANKMAFSLVHQVLAVYLHFLINKIIIQKV